MIPDYASSLIEAERALRKCHTAIIDEADFAKAIKLASDAEHATKMVQLDLMLKLTRGRR
jgi:hypothetical protein